MAWNKRNGFCSVSHLKLEIINHVRRAGGRNFIILQKIQRSISMMKTDGFQDKIY